MAIDFVNDILDVKGGSINKVAGLMADLRKKVSSVSYILAQTDYLLQNISTELPDPLPSLGEIDTKLNQIKGEVSDRTGDIISVVDMTGTCFSGELSALSSMVRDVFGLVDDGMAKLNEIENIPHDMLDLGNRFNQAKDLINNLGIGDIIANIIGSLGCMGDSSLIDEVNAELNALTSKIGILPTGKQDPDAYKQMMSDKLSTVTGLDPTYKTYLEDGMSSMAESVNEMGITTKQSMKDGIYSLKNSIPKLPALPKYF